MGGCYAAALGDCDGRLSSEHYVSEAALAVIGNTVRVEGFPWLPSGTYRDLPTAALVANVLCERHNLALEPLDRVGGRFFRTLRQFNLPPSEYTNPSAESRFFAGPDLERWLLKILMGSLASGNARVGVEPAPVWRPPLEWLRLLFRDEEWRCGTGLFVAAAVGATEIIHTGFRVGTLSDLDTGEVTGAHVRITGLRFLLPVSRRPRGTLGAAFEHAVYRPRRLVFNKVKSVEICWRHCEYTDEIEFDCT